MFKDWGKVLSVFSLDSGMRPRPCSLRFTTEIISWLSEKYLHPCLSIYVREINTYSSFGPKTPESRVYLRRNLMSDLNLLLKLALVSIWKKYDLCDKPIVAKWTAWPWPQVATDSRGNWAAVSGHWRGQITSLNFQEPFVWGYDTSLKSDGHILNKMPHSCFMLGV